MNNTHGLLNSAPQRGKPGSCYLAQIFDADDKSVATIDATQDEAEGTERARRLVACWNACDGIATDVLEQGRVSPDAFRQEESRADRAEVQCEELLKLVASFAQLFDEWEQIIPQDARAEFHPVYEQARTAIAKATCQEQVGINGLTEAETSASMSVIGLRNTGNVGAEDPLYPQALEVVRKFKRGSISLVQRHLRIGYNRTAYMVEAMEKAGIITPWGENGTGRELVPDAKNGTP